MEYEIHDYSISSFYRDYNKREIIFTLISENTKTIKKLQFSDVLFVKSNNDYEGCILLDAEVADIEVLLKQYSFEEILEEDNGGLYFSRCKNIEEVKKIINDNNIQIFIYNSSYGQYGYIYFTGKICLTIAST